MAAAPKPAAPAASPNPAAATDLAAQIAALTAEKDKIAADAQSAAKTAKKALIAARAEIAALTEEKAKAVSSAATAQSELDAVRAQLRKPSSGDSAQAQEQIKLLTEERNRLSSDFARISAAAEAVAHELAAAREHIAGLTELRDRAGAESAEIRAWAENVLAHANRLHERLQLLDKESLTAFLRRRYLRRG